MMLPQSSTATAADGPPMPLSMSTTQMWLPNRASDLAVVVVDRPSPISIPLGKFVYAANAISWIVLPGRASLTKNLPFVHSRSSSDASRNCAASLRALSLILGGHRGGRSEVGVDREPYVPSPYGAVSVSPY
jgi:hypothetical protein